MFRLFSSDQKFQSLSLTVNLSLFIFISVNLGLISKHDVGFERIAFPTKGDFKISHPTLLTNAPYVLVVETQSAVGL